MEITIIICDRCKKEFKYPVIRKLSIPSKDLCQTCCDDLEKWFKNVDSKSTNKGEVI